MKKILVTGGTGYIGSHTAIDLISNGYEVIILDNLSRSEATSIDRIEAITGVRPKFYEIDLCDKKETFAFFEKEKNIDGIIHFAAYKYVNESVTNPILYFRNNNDSLLNLLECLDTFSIKNFVFSSSCSVYGNINQLPVNEDTPLNKAESPYARTKQMGEMMIEDVSQISAAQFISLRYFNPVGAHESAKIGESPSVIPNNLVPRITGTAMGKFEKLSVFGTELPTRDGSCIRDYIHVMDLAEAHTAALKLLLEGKSTKKHDIINIGSGNGVSVLEAIHAFEKVSHQKLNVAYASPREGDLVAIYSDCTKSKEVLNWEAKRSIEEMMLSAWNWELANK
jgi:UDP-glucose 4-epimerase